MGYNTLEIIEKTRFGKILDCEQVICNKSIYIYINLYIFIHIWPIFSNFQIFVWATIIKVIPWTAWALARSQKYSYRSGFLKREQKSELKPAQKILKKGLRTGAYNENSSYILSLSIKVSWMLFPLEVYKFFLKNAKMIITTLQLLNLNNPFLQHFT